MAEDNSILGLAVSPSSNPNLFMVQQRLMGGKDREDKARLAAAAAGAAPMFNSMGHEDATQFGALLTSDPEAALTLAAQFGGMEKLYGVMQVGLARKQIAGALTGMSGHPNAPDMAALVEAGVPVDQVDDYIKQLTAAKTPTLDIPDDLINELAGKSLNEQANILANANLKPTDISSIIKALNPKVSNNGLDIEFDENGNVKRIVQGLGDTTKADRMKMARSRANSVSSIGEGARLLGMMSKTGGLAGASGNYAAIATGISSVAERYNLVEKGTTDEISQVMTGAGEVELGDFQTSAQAFGISMREELTGDVSRLSDFDVRNLKKAVGILEDTSDAVKASGSIRRLMTLKIKNDLLLGIEVGVESPLDPTLPGGAQRMGEFLTSMGMKTDDVKEFMARLVPEIAAQKKFSEF